MPWVWNPEKNAANKTKHRLSFEIAMLVFDDTNAISRIDVYPHEERLHTIGLVNGIEILVIHTPLKYDPATGEETGRIISARKATQCEREAYYRKGYIE